VIEVSDEGPGVPQELRAHIFDRFVRGEGDSGRTGSGLGLAIVWAVAESLGGTVELTDNEAGGARFTVRLPAADSRREDAPPPPAEAEPAARRS
jgi:signal transduction histidine kinase